MISFLTWFSTPPRPSPHPRGLRKRRTLGLCCCHNIGVFFFFFCLFINSLFFQLCRIHVNQSPSKYDYKHIFLIPGFPSNPEESHKKTHLLLTSMVSRLNSGCACVFMRIRGNLHYREIPTATQRISGDKQYHGVGVGLGMGYEGLWKEGILYLSAECASVWPLGPSEALQEFMRKEPRGSSKRQGRSKLRTEFQSRYY